MSALRVHTNTDQWTQESPIRLCMFRRTPRHPSTFWRSRVKTEGTHSAPGGGGLGLGGGPGGGLGGGGLDGGGGDASRVTAGWETDALVWPQR